MPSFEELYKDEEFHILEELACLLDGRLDRLEEIAEKCPDPIAWGYYDSADAACGLGLAAVQQFIASTAAFAGVKKSTALACGPVLASGLTVAEGVTHAANWWKHCDEWQLAADQAAKTIHGMKALGVPVDEDCYVLTVALRKLVEPKNSYRFRELLPLIKAWQENVQSRFCADAGGAK